MNNWRSQHFLKIGRQRGVKHSILENAIETAAITVQRGCGAPPILTLRHLCHLSGGSYPFLREVIGRRKSENHYRTFAIRKRKSQMKNSRRIISIPDPRLLNVQRWINHNILAKAAPHSASLAFSPGCTLRNAALPHCGARWLIKLDVRRFFESISEISVYHVFIKLGYQPLIAFELARLCTRPRSIPIKDNTGQWYIRIRKNSPSFYATYFMGYLPQGAPTSPMLANLAVRLLDEELDSIASERGLNYSRYADDLTFSTQSSSFCKTQAIDIVRNVYRELELNLLAPNKKKTVIIPPGARKIVLGLLVDGDAPRLTRQFRRGMRQHLYYLSHKDYGPEVHAKNRNFQCVGGLRNYLYGLVAYAGQIDSMYADQCRKELDSIQWQTSPLNL